MLVGWRVDILNEVMNCESVIVWEDGIPCVKLVEMLEKDNITDLPIAALSLPYVRSDKDIFLERDLEFEGKSNAEVMNIRLARKAANGNIQAIKTITERVLGKPKQQIEKHTVSETYLEWMERKSEEEEELIKELDHEEVIVEG